MMMKKMTGAWCGVVVFAAVAGCGGDTGGTSIAGISRLGVSSGPITGFGSIFVSDDEFSTDTATFDIDDDSTGANQSDLAIGDFVIVTFDPSDPTSAVTVFADDLVEGPVSSRDLVASTLVVAGQTVIIDGNTVFDNSISPASINGISVNDIIEVNGQFDAQGDIRASRIEPGAGETEVHGVISALDAGAMTFMIRALDVNFASAVIDSRIAGGVLANGDFVEVRGAITGGTLNATRVEPSAFGIAADDDIDFDDFDEVDIEIEGFITRFVSATDFDVAGLPVTTNGSTMFEGGVVGDLGLNVKIEVEGTLNAANVLVAEEIDIRRADALRVTALVDSVNVTADTFDVLGVTIRVDEQTRFEDDSNAEDNPFSLAKLNAGNYVEVRGGTDGSGGAAIIASEVEREDVPNVPGEDTEVRGPVETVSQPSFTILGVTIETHAGTEFEDADGMVMSASDFFNALAPGDAVEAEGVETSQATLLADEVEFEDET